MVKQATVEPEIRAVVKFSVLTCAHDTNVPPQQAEHFMPEKSSLMENYTHDMKCFLLCFYRKMDLITYDDHPNHEAFASFMEKRFVSNKDRIKPALAKCLDIDDKDPCEEVYKFELCMLKNVQG
uniref:PBP/GOBP family protein n=1 Tax=Musca domestica TaxID=7370 RepID=A0A1I8NJS3_MUSDO